VNFSHISKFQILGCDIPPPNVPGSLNIRMHCIVWDLYCRRGKAYPIHARQMLFCLSKMAFEVVSTWKSFISEHSIRLLFIKVLEYIFLFETCPFHLFLWFSIIFVDFLFFFSLELTNLHSLTPVWLFTASPSSVLLSPVISWRWQWHLLDSVSL
jgi:hypothetical protein